MICDIHAFIDYDLAGKTDNELVHYLGEFNIWRNYALFGMMAGVCQPELTIFKARGLPCRLSFTVRDRASLLIQDENNPFENFPDDRTCTKRDVEIWNGKYTDDTKRRIWHPDLHSHSWLNTVEANLVLNRFKETGGVSHGLSAACGAMQALQKEGCVPRLVFWFDN